MRDTNWTKYKLFCRINGLVEGNFRSLEMFACCYYIDEFMEGYE